MAEKPIELSKLGVGVLQKIDMGSIGADAVTMSMDTTESDNQVKQLITELTQTLNNAQEFDKYCLKDGFNILKDATGKFTNGMSLIAQWSRTAALARKGNLGASAMLFSQRIDLLAQNYHVDFWSRILYDIPEQIAQKKVSKWYNSAFPTEEPTEKDMLFLVINGMKDPSDLLTKYQEDMSFTKDDAVNLATLRKWQIGQPSLTEAMSFVDNGFWAKSDWINLARLGYGMTATTAENYFNTLKWQIGVPSLREAWVMVQRGYWQKADWLNLARLGHGFTAGDAENYYQLMNYDPSLGDVMSLSNLIPLEPAWVAQKLARTGMSQSDQNIFIDAINKKIIMQEIRSFWGTILQTYSYGGYNPTELTALLRTWKFTDAEINIKIATAELSKQKMVNSLMRDADIYLARSGTIDWNELYTRLLAQNLPQEVANAITRNEACKKGVDWELTP